MPTAHPQDPLHHPPPRPARTCLHREGGLTAVHCIPVKGVHLEVDLPCKYPHSRCGVGSEPASLPRPQWCWSLEDAAAEPQLLRQASTHCRHACAKTANRLAVTSVGHFGQVGLHPLHRLSLERTKKPCASLHPEAPGSLQPS